MKKNILTAGILLTGALMTSCSQKTAQTEEQTMGLADAYADCWYTGVSVNQWEVAASDAELNHIIRATSATTRRHNGTRSPRTSIGQ